MRRREFLLAAAAAVMFAPGYAWAHHRPWHTRRGGSTPPTTCDVPPGFVVPSLTSPAVC